MALEPLERGGDRVGVGRGPLTERRHWSRARTRLVEVPVDGTVLTGRVQAVADDGVELEVDGARRTVPWEQLGTGRVQVEFRRPDAADDEPDETDDDPDDEPDDELDDELDETDDDLPDDGHDEAEED